jgi:hypothetical protein
MIRERKVIDVLKPEQQAKWNDMLGDPFKGPIPSPILVPAINPAGLVPAKMPYSR